MSQSRPKRDSRGCDWDILGVLSGHKPRSKVSREGNGKHQGRYHGGREASGEG